MSEFWKNYKKARSLHAEGRYEASAAAAFTALECTQMPSEQAMGHWLLYANAFRVGNGDAAIRHLELALKLESDHAQRLRLQCALVGQYRQQGMLAKALEMQANVLAAMNWPNGASIDYDFTRELWFAQNHETFRSTLTDLLLRFPHLEIIEIGSLQGMSACFMVDFLSRRCKFKLTCIDPAFQPEFWANIERSQRGENVFAIEGKSQDVLGTLDPQKFHFIHIDGWHVATQVFLDAFYAMGLAAPGASILFDDYLKEDQTAKGQTVKLGAMAFRKVFEPYLQIQHEGRQLVCMVGTEPIEMSSIVPRTNSMISQILGHPVSLEASNLLELANAVHEHMESLLSASWRGVFPDAE